MIRKSLTILLLLPQIGCAVPVTQITGSNGQPAFSMKCSGMGRDRQDCLTKAGEICPKGYSILDDNSQTNGAVMSQGSLIIAHKEYMTISCR